MALRGEQARAAWRSRLDGHADKSAFEKALATDFAEEATAALNALKATFADERPKVATRKASQMALEAVNPVATVMVGGSADLTGSNNTKTKDLGDFSSADYAGRYVYYGIREHGMAAAMNGMALHGGVIPYGGTFMVFTDYCRPSIRLAALMGVGAIYVMTHDSIGLGEDGPTHQPVEHLAACRAIPGLNVYRPCDAVETAECWALAIADRKTPSMLVLTRQGLEQARLDYEEDNLCAKGAYILADAPDPQVTIIATGSEVSIALQAQKSLACDAIRARVVSAPCFERFAAQPEDYRKTVLGASPRIGVEAAIRQGWDALLRPEDAFIGMKSFGASAPATDLFEHFGVTAAAIDAAARNAIA